MRNSLIYAWTCPETGMVVYVGKTSMTISRRMASHMGEARRHPKTKKELWLASLLSRGLKPNVEVLEEVPIDRSSDAERRWANSFLLNGPLLNSDRIGAGNPGVGRVEWTDKTLSMLGKAADSKIASMLGCERKTVSYKRECLGIPAGHDRTNNSPPPPRGGWNKLTLPADTVSRLGAVPDYVLASEIGCDKQVIARARLSSGIRDYAATTGRDGQFAAERPHPRWLKRAEQRLKASLSPDADFVTDAVWGAVSSLFPPAPKNGRRDYDDRTMLRGVLWILRSGAKWIDLPQESMCGAGTSVFRRFANLIERGHWAGIEASLKETLPNPDDFDWSRARAPGRKRE
jgi:hypothetical protein